MSEPWPTEIKVSATTQVEVHMRDPEEDDGFEPWIDRIRAVWYPGTGRPTDTGGWWDVSGRNSGAGNGMIIHPYQIDPFIELLQELKRQSHLEQGAPSQ